ncbi:MAG: hypothetical protein Q9204_008672, partial [Flavoplaca sp. TL-2023a]
MVDEAFDDEAGHTGRGDVVALEENADAADEPGEVAGADDVFAFEEEFEVGEGE